MIWILALLACKGEPTKTQKRDSPLVPNPPAFEDEAAEIACAAFSEAPLMDQVLANANLSVDEIGYDDADWQGASYRDVLDDPFLLPWFRGVHWSPLEVQCHSGQIAADLDHAAATEHPVATAIGEAMGLLAEDRVAVPIDPWNLTQDLVDLSELPADLAEALVPIIVAMQAVAEARDAMDDAAPQGNKELVENGHAGVMIDVRQGHPNLAAPIVQEWILSEDGPRRMYDPARVLAFAIEHAELGQFAGEDVTFDAKTDLGKIIVAGPGDDAPGDIGNIALYLDLGGNDTYIHPAGANNAAVSVAVHIDLGGADTYGYDERDGGTDQLLPADIAGRYDGDFDANFGDFALSREGRQGAGRFGVGMLFDYGGDDDIYRSLRMSQGYGHLGLGALYDDGGDDSYDGEGGVQGAGILGIGLLIDAGGNDAYNTFTYSQGFGYSQGVGIAWDGGGDDVWFANPGKTEDSGLTIYYSPQLPGNGNNSFVQGAGYGYRADGVDTWLSGGIGVLRDVDGDDDYTASVFSQGTGYWQGTGYLIDGGGNDNYDAHYYAQGGAAHYAVGGLFDAGEGDDKINVGMSSNSMHVGAGHDYSVGVHVNDGGDDEYVYGSLGAGASNCQGVGLFVDNGGSDTYSPNTSYSTGLGNHSTECESPQRAVGQSVGLFLDSGGATDTYNWPFDDQHPIPGDDTTFGVRWHDTDDEHGGGIDGDGLTGVYAKGSVP